jgi:hypothetical protein
MINLKNGQVPNHTYTNISGFTPKYKILLLKLSSPDLEVTQKGHTPVGEKP